MTYSTLSYSLCKSSSVGTYSCTGHKVRLEYPSIFQSLTSVIRSYLQCIGVNIFGYPAPRLFKPVISLECRVKSTFFISLMDPNIIRYIIYMSDLTVSKDRSARTVGIVVVGLLIAYFPNYINPILRLFDIPLPLGGPPSIILWNWIAVIILALYIVYVEHEKLTSIRMAKPTEKDISWAFYFWGIAMVWFWLSSIFFPQVNSANGTDAITSLAIPVVILLIITAAFTEEFLWRGYVIERLGKLTGKIWVGAVLSFVVFLIPHIVTFGPEWILYHAIGAVLIYVLYVWRRNLWAVILLHFLLDAPILIPTLMS